MLTITAFFLASRAAGYAAGIRFDSSPIGMYWQLVDPDLLRTRLLESLFYLHSQPPLFNLYLGVLLKAFGAHYASVAQASFLVLGLVGALALYGLLVKTGCAISLSVAVTLLVTIAPATILYENWLFYEYPTALLLVLSAFALARFMRKRSFWPGFLFFLLLAGVIWIRSTFQIVWMLLVVLLVLFALRDRRRVVLRACLLPLVLVVVLYAKNVAVFGTPSTSSWFGMNLALAVFTSVPPAERGRLVDRGELSRVSLVRPFAPLSAYRGLVPLSRPTGVAVLDETRLPRGTPNLNNKSYLRISNLYLRDSLRLIRMKPRSYFRSVVWASKLALRPSSDYTFVARNRAKIHSYTQAFHRAVYVQTRYASGMGLAIVGAYALALLYGLRLLRLWAEAARRSDPKLVTLLYAWLTVAYVILVIAFTSAAENQRIRFAVDPLVAVLVASALSEVWVALRRRLLGRRVIPPPAT